MDFKFQKKVLKNGMTILFEKRDLPVVSVAFAVRQGGINEDIGEKGISHFIEHMLYKGTPTRNAKKIAEEIEKNGGVLNGFTEELITAYWCKLPSKYINIALNVLSDMIKNPLFDKKELEKERKVIFEEINMIKDNPVSYVFDEVQSYLYEGTLGKSLIGNYETLETIDRKKMIDKFEEIYKPNNLILCVVGNANFDEIVRFAESNFASKKGIIKEFNVVFKNKSRIEKRKGIDQANFVFAYHTPLAGNKKSHASKVLSTLMAEGMSSRLFSEIRQKRNLAYAVKGGSNINKDFAYNFIYVGTNKENVEIVKELILEEFKKVSESLTEHELEQVKGQIIGNYQISMEDSHDQMVNLLFYEIDGNAEEFYNFEKNIRDVKLEDVKELAKKIRDKYSFFALVPEK